ncbi:MAG TPA: hypothetical protein VJR89_19130 [Polyangiales bacterium]|nr:hypothetical protein [Polyangiales bacterium]
MSRLARTPLALLVWLCASCETGLCAHEACIDAGPSPISDPSQDAAAHVVGAAEACSAQSVHAMRGPPRPVDVIFVIDNSGSMDEEIAAVRNNINQDFASIIAASGVDYHVIVISRYGNDSLGVCIEPPLAHSACAAGLQETNSNVFYHYDQEIGSSDALCQILTTFDRPDASGRAPQGWQAWLRPEAQKAFVLITDDSPLCTYQSGEVNVGFGGVGVDPFEDALNFHRVLLARSGAQFGVPPDVKYQFFSIIGLAANTLPGEPYFPHQGIVNKACDTAPGNGPTYQALSVITDALRYPVCEGRSFDAVFRVLARSVIQASQADCEFEVPKAPTDQVLVLDSVNLEYRPGDGSAPVRFKQVASATSCKTANSFYISDRIRLCPAACSLVKKDPTPEVQILFGCQGIPQ